MFESRGFSKRARKEIPELSSTLSTMYAWKFAFVNGNLATFISLFAGVSEGISFENKVYASGQEGLNN